MNDCLKIDEMDNDFSIFAENIALKVIKDFRMKHPLERIFWNGRFVDDSCGSFVIGGIERNAVEWHVTVFIERIGELGRAKLTIMLAGTPLSQKYEIAWDESLEPSNYSVRRISDVVGKMFEHVERVKQEKYAII